MPYCPYFVASFPYGKSALAVALAAVEVALAAALAAVVAAVAAALSVCCLSDRHKVQSIGQRDSRRLPFDGIWRY